MTTALDSLYGKASALSGNVGGQDREQEVWTPDWIITAARQALGGIQLDPCGATSFDGQVWDKKKEVWNPTTGGWFADVTLVKPGTHEGLVKGPHGGTVVCLDGLLQDWTQAESVFLNPVYDPFEPWIEKAGQTGRTGTKTVLLGPFRCHRPYFWSALEGAEIVTLYYRVIFKGHTNAIPFPLFLAAWNCRIPPLGEKETGRIQR